jgi:cytochrome c
MADAAPPGNAVNGKKVFTRSCQTCHALVGKDKHQMGPDIGLVYGRKAGTAKGFKYSTAMSSSGLVWTPENLDKWLENPGGFVSGSSMTFAGLPNEKERQDIIRLLYESNPKNKKK